MGELRLYQFNIICFIVFRAEKVICTAECLYEQKRGESFYKNLFVGLKKIMDWKHKFFS